VAGTITCQTAIVADIENPSGGGPGRQETEAFSTADCFAEKCEPAGALEMNVTPEDLPWAGELEEAGEEKGKVIIRNRTQAVSQTLNPGPWLVGSGEDHGVGESLPSTVGMQLTSHCVFRPGYARIVVAGQVQAEEEAKGKSKAEAEAIGKAAGEHFEKEALEKDPNSPGNPALINVPGDPLVTCAGEVAPRLKNGTGIGSKPATVEYDQPATGPLNCEEAPTGHVIGPGLITEKLKSMGYEGQEITNAF
jgi:hypothetical protein